MNDSNSKSAAYYNPEKKGRKMLAYHGVNKIVLFWF
jgi:hypothetical protein